MHYSTPENPVINQADQLAQFCAQIRNSTWIALDTEFLRENTYYPKLCLLQIADQEHIACVDILALSDLTPLLDILYSKQLTCILHSAKQDLETLFLLTKKLPPRLFDTQIAANILGLGEQISYAELVEIQCSVQLTKSQSRTDWSRRPLSEAQIQYALDDVRYLGQIYESLRTQITQAQRGHWLSEECEDLLDDRHYQIPPDTAWRRIKGAGKLPNHAVAIFQSLAAWREQLAQEENIPRQWIVRDRLLLELCSERLFSPNALKHFLLKEQPKAKPYLPALIERIEQSQAQDVRANSLNSGPEAGPEARLTPEQRNLVKKLSKHVRERAQNLRTSPSLLANRKSLERLARGKTASFLEGWRHDVIGKELLELAEASK